MYVWEPHIDESQISHKHKRFRDRKFKGGIKWHSELRLRYGNLRLQRGRRPFKDEK